MAFSVTDLDGVSPGPTTRRGLLAGAAVAAAGATGLGYAWCEARWFALRHVTVPVLPPGAAELRVLHLSDLHLTPYQRRKREWLASLRTLEPDLVVNTGDNIAHRESVEPLMAALGPLAEVPGVFVLGSNDYYSPTPRNPLRYLVPDGRRYTSSRALPWQHLIDRLGESGWVELTNRHAQLTVKGVRLAFVGVDDPHLRYDDLDAVKRPAERDADLRVGVSHAPYLRVLDRFAEDGYDLTFAGHTHGGQLCLPFKGALVTNCDIEPARAKGLHRHPATSSPGEAGSSWLHVSAGAGTSPFAVARFCCRPEATLVRLTQRPASG